MKKNIFIALASAMVMLVASCQKPADVINNVGYLSFSEFSLGFDEEVDTKATAASGNYIITILNSSEDVVVTKSYSEIKNNDNKLSLSAGAYTLVARSSDIMPVAEFDVPVYGVSRAFTIEAGQETVIGELVCTLLQCKVTVDYSPEFLQTVTGACSTKVEVTSGNGLTYNLNADGSYEDRSGYFEVTGSTMTVVFKGSIDGKSKSMTKVYSNIAPKQWRKIKFIQKVDEQGNATFDIVINKLIDDVTLNGTTSVEENILGDDPDAPKGDGGITLVPDYDSGCDAEIADLQNIHIYPVAEKDMSIKFKATIPNGVKKFTVNIDSTSEGFLTAVDAAYARNLNLINPLPENDIIFTVVPFPHGEELLNQTEVLFDLSAAQDAIIHYVGTHTFTMLIVDNEGCRKEVSVVMVVE